jgi:hypothetical protein
MAVAWSELIKWLKSPRVGAYADDPVDVAELRQANPCGSTIYIQHLFSFLPASIFGILLDRS